MGRPEYYNKLLKRVDKFLKAATDKVAKKPGLGLVPDLEEEKSFWDSKSDCDEEVMAEKHLKCQVPFLFCAPTTDNKSIKESPKDSITSGSCRERLINFNPVFVSS